MEREFNWVLSSGKQAKLVAKYEEVMEDEVIKLDGLIFTGKAKPTDAGRSDLTLFIDGEEVKNCRDKAFWRLSDCENGVKKIWGLPIGFVGENIQNYQKFIEEVIKDGTSDAVKIYREMEAKEENKKEVEKAKKAIEKAERQTTIPTEEQVKIIRKAYNNINNEGGCGFVPNIISKEEYEKALEIVENGNRR